MSTSREPVMPTDAPPEVQTPSPPLSRDEHLLAFVREHEARCPLCDYNLRGLSRPTCPECGQELKLDVRLAEPYLAAWVTLVVALSLAAGPGAMFILMSVMHGPPGGPWYRVLIMPYAVAAIPLLIVALFARRRVCRLPRPAQWLLALAPVFMGVLMLVWTFAYRMIF